ncbi:MAG: FAD-dependent thymidylate synthase [Candidatus Aenigmatarchaeota archaeon]|nr:MAG: FAD-dependent thymidylate synthase [Candidatus Aenigmarchaeota archaeon]
MFSKEDLGILRNHVSNVDSDVYVIKNLPPEVVAVLFAYVSRSPASFRENLLKLIKSKDLDMGGLVSVYSDRGIDYAEAKEKARKFHEKWVVGYGHSSVAEHAVASIALENVSILATKAIEDTRLASFTEKSTRYQIFDREKYYTPGIVMKSESGGLYKKTCESLFDLYIEILPKLITHFRKKNPKPKGMGDRVYESVTKARACDVARYVLPAATLTNLGMTVNARSLEHMIRKLLSHPLKEMNGIGTNIKEEVLKIIPTLVKYADLNPYILETGRAMESLCGGFELERNVKNRPVTLVGYDRDAENKLVSSIIYRYSHRQYEDILAKVSKMNAKEKEKVFGEYLKRMGAHDPPMRELEHVYYTFDILIDYGAFRDIQRHRICTQTNQELTTTHGYDIPEEIEKIGYGEKFREAMKSAERTFERIRKRFPKEAQYVVPLAFRKRTLFTWNLRELYHFVRLRSGKEGHISYRRIAWEVYRELKRVHPLLAKYIKVDLSKGILR